MIPDGPALRIPLPEFLADPALRQVLAALPGLRVVGGAVRDAVAGSPVTDVDLATPLPPEGIIAALRAAGIRALPTGIEHGTITALVQGAGFEVTTLRRDIATDGRHATVAFTDDWREDAARRDFTINAMSMSPSGEVFDYFGGLADLRAGIVRFVGDPATRISEDYLRILRFFRFQARYTAKGAIPDPVSLQAIRDGVPGLAILSPERVWSELRRILAAPDPGGAIARMAELGVLATLLPGGNAAQLSRLIAAGAPADPLLRLAALLAGTRSNVAALAAGLRLSTADDVRLRALCEPQSLAPSASDDSIRRALADTSAEILIDRLWIAQGSAPDLIEFGAEPPFLPDWPARRARVASIPRPVFPLEGRDVLALGVSPGPRVGALLRQVRAWWLDAGCVPDANSCRAELARQAAG